MKDQLLEAALCYVLGVLGGYVSNITYLFYEKSKNYLKEYFLSLRVDLSSRGMAVKGMPSILLSILVDPVLTY